jgi:hypothetical protein
MKKTLLISTLLCLPFVGHAQNYGGVEGGWASIDIGAKTTAQTLANLSGSTVTYRYDTGAVAGRVFVGFPMTDSVSLEVGGFMTGDVKATYTISGASATESYSGQGVDISAVFKPEGGSFFLKAGMHSSTVDGNASIRIGATTYAAGASKSGTGFLMGVGGESKLDDKSAIRYAATYYDKLGGISGADAALFTIGYVVRFD